MSLRKHNDFAVNMSSHRDAQLLHSFWNSLTFIWYNIYDITVQNIMVYYPRNGRHSLEFLKKTQKLEIKGRKQCI